MFLSVLEFFWIFLRKFEQHFLYESFALSSLHELGNKEKKENKRLPYLAYKSPKVMEDKEGQEGVEMGCKIFIF